MQTENIFSAPDGKRLLSIYYTAGYPTLNSTLPIAEALERAGVDFLEIGFPYSDPVADGEAIQHSSEVALTNGMNLQTLFAQLKDLRKRVSIPVFLMGYFNPVLRYGVESFCQSCREAGVTGAIIPDLPMDEYESMYGDVFEHPENRPDFRQLHLPALVQRHHGRNAGGGGGFGGVLQADPGHEAAASAGHRLRHFLCRNFPQGHGPCPGRDRGQRVRPAAGRGGLRKPHRAVRSGIETGEIKTLPTSIRNYRTWHVRRRFPSIPLPALRTACPVCAGFRAVARPNRAGIKVSVQKGQRGESHPGF